MAAKLQNQKKNTAVLGKTRLFCTTKIKTNRFKNYIIFILLERHLKFLRSRPKNQHRSKRIRCKHCLKCTILKALAEFFL